MKIEIEVTNPEQAAQIMALLSGGSASPSEALEGARVEKAAAAPARRKPGRPRMTEAEKAEAAKKRAAAAAAKEEPEDDEDDEDINTPMALVKPKSKKAPEPEPEDDEDEDEADEAPEEPEEDDSDDDEDDSDADPMEEAVELATKYLRDGNGKEVRRALKSVGASRVSDLKGAKVQEFLDIIKSI